MAHRRAAQPGGEHPETPSVGPDEPIDETLPARAYPFQGHRVGLRAFEAQDVPALQAYLNHPDLAGRRYVPWELPADIPLSAGQVETILEKWRQDERAAHLGVVRHEGGELVGHVELDWGWDPHAPEVAAVIAPLHQRGGYGAEALSLLLDYAFGDTPAHTIGSWIADWNQAGQAFARHMGFQESGRMRRAGLHRGAYFDLLLFDILRPEWRRREVEHAP